MKEEMSSSIASHTLVHAPRDVLLALSQMEQICKASPLVALACGQPELVHRRPASASASPSTPLQLRRGAGQSSRLPVCYRPSYTPSLGTFLELEEGGDHPLCRGFVISWQWSLLDKLGKILCFVQKELIQNICQIWEAAALCQIWEAAACVLSCKGKHFVCPCGGDEPLQNCVKVSSEMVCHMLDRQFDDHYPRMLDTAHMNLYMDLGTDPHEAYWICNFIAMVCISLLGKLGEMLCSVQRGLIQSATNVLDVSTFPNEWS